MKQFTTLKDVEDPSGLVEKTLKIKANPFGNKIGQNRTLGLIFFNPSLRTRLSTQRAAFNLGMNVIVMDIGKDGWNIEFEDGSVMDGSTQEHIKDAVKVISQYVDIIGVRTFAGLTNRDEDYDEKVLSQFKAYSLVPVVSLESATLHPLQSLADLATIAELKIKQPKVVLSWAPHPKALPQAVANSFLQWIKTTDAHVTLTCPKGYELKGEFTNGITIEHDQNKAFENADVVYAKNWSSYTNYGQRMDVSSNWTITEQKMGLTNNAAFMHCLPMRRNVVATDGVIDNSLVYDQAQNRQHSVQAVLSQLLHEL